MNICVLKESLNIGGTERSAANVSKVLAKEHNIWVALYDTSQMAYSYAGELADFCLPPKNSIIGKVINTFYRDFKLRQLLKKNKIDILYTFTGIGNKQTHFKYNTIKIISARDFGGMQERFTEYNAALNNSDAMICNSEYTKNFYISKYPEHADRVYALYNYIDIAEICEQAKEEPEAGFIEFLQQHPRTIVSVGRFCKEKAFEYLIEAFASARENDEGLGLVLVGDGEYRQRYDDVIKNSAVGEHIYFTGFQKNPYKYMARCSCFVLSSLSEGFPNVIAEAMALGMPVVADNCYSGPAEILRKDKNYEAVTDSFLECDYGIMTPRITQENNRNAVDELAAAVNYLLGNTEKMRHYAEMSAIRAEDFSMESTLEQLDSIFSRLSARRSNSSD